MPRAGFSGVLEDSPNKQTKLFAGVPINLSAVARAVNVSPSALSRIFAGKKQPSLALCRQLADVLLMSLDEFVANLPNNNDEVTTGSVDCQIKVDKCA